MSLAVPARLLAQEVRLSLRLLAGRHLVAICVVDGLLLLLGVLDYLLSGAVASALYRQLMIHPPLLLGVPLLSRLVAVERTAGSLDLALSVPRVEAYFLRRAAVVCALLILQGWIILGLAWLFGSSRFPLLSTLSQSATACLFLGALALFWAVRLQSSGAVAVATLMGALLLGRWFLWNPIPERLTDEGGWWLPGAEGTLDWLSSLAVLLLATVLLYLYSRRRLRRPETIL